MFAGVDGDGEDVAYHDDTQGNAAVSALAAGAKIEVIFLESNAI